MKLKITRLYAPRTKFRYDRTRKYNVPLRGWWNTVRGYELRLEDGTKLRFMVGPTQNQFTSATNCGLYAIASRLSEVPDAGTEVVCSIPVQ